MRNAGGRRHPLLEGFDETPRIINGVFRLDVAPTQAFPSPLTLIPTLSRSADGGRLSTRAAHDDPRGVSARIGTSRVVYFPWDIDRTFWDVLCGITAAAAERGALGRNEPPPVEVDGPGVLDVTIWRQRDSITVHLVNLTNPMMMKGPVREVIPVGPQRVRIRLPEGAIARNVELLTAGTRPAVERTTGGLSVTVPSIDVHEVIAIDL